MATILRVKRRNTDQPQDTLILAKRPKLADDDGATCSVVHTLAKFAGTLKDPNENVVQHLAQVLNKEELKSNFKKHIPVDILTKMRAEVKNSSAVQRYKVVNYQRSRDTSNVEKFEDKTMTFLDLVDSASCTENQNAEKISDCVYDLYYAETKDDDYIDECVAIYVHDHDLQFETYKDESDPSSDSDDSNAESNWRNDYPDEYSENSTDGDDTKDTFDILTSGCRELSSDEDEEDFAYAVDKRDVEMYGYKYARYKQRMKAQYNDENEETDKSDLTSDSNSDSRSDEDFLHSNSCNKINITEINNTQSTETF